MGEEVKPRTYCLGYLGKAIEETDGLPEVSLAVHYMEMPGDGFVFYDHPGGKIFLKYGERIRFREDGSCEITKQEPKR